jgi:hypothetical protein
MSSTQTEFIANNLSNLGYTSKQDIIERLYLFSLIGAYDRVDKTISTENDIRDRFCDDLHKNEKSPLRKWLQYKIIFLNWENWSFSGDGAQVRSDFSFKFSGMEFIIECKRLKSADGAYITNGLERFINLQYAEGDELAGMIGFVISGDQAAISSTLQSKIEALAHTLAVSPSSPTPFFNSSHQRSDTSSIWLYHMFFDFKIH